MLLDCCGVDLLEDNLDLLCKPSKKALSIKLSNLIDDKIESRRILDLIDY